MQSCFPDESHQFLVTAAAKILPVYASYAYFCQPRWGPTQGHRRHPKSSQGIVGQDNGPGLWHDDSVDNNAVKNESRAYAN